MKNFKFIELPKEEVLNEIELSYIEGASNCVNYISCNIQESGKSNCGIYDGNQCAGNGGCSPSLYCNNYSF